MTRLLRLTPFTWPYSLQQLREDEPTRSFSNNPSRQDYAAYDVIIYDSTPRPQHDPALERVEEARPVLIDGRWQQQWEIVPLTTEEQQAYYRATHPPRWVEFGSAVLALPQIKTLLDLGLDQASPLALALAVGLGKAADGDPRVFVDAWGQAIAAGLVPPDLPAGLQQLATAHDLPADFIAALQP